MSFVFGVVSVAMVTGSSVELLSGVVDVGVDAGVVVGDEVVEGGDASDVVVPLVDVVDVLSGDLVVGFTVVLTVSGGRRQIGFRFSAVKSHFEVQ